jgi:hypothetical protein
LQLSSDGITYGTIDSSQVEDKPELVQYSLQTSNFAVSDKGKTYHVRIQAKNDAGLVTSQSLAVILADKPGTPSQGPTKDSMTSRSKLVITLTAESNTGNSPITGYSLEVDDGEGGDFVSEGSS